MNSNFNKKNNNIIKKNFDKNINSNSNDNKNIKTNYTCKRKIALVFERKHTHAFVWHRYFETTGTDSVVSIEFGIL